jgi:hypothetical protein
MVRIVDDAMPNFAALQERVLSPGFPWYYARQTKKEDAGANPWLNGWVHLVYDGGQFYSHDHPLFTEQIGYLLGALGEQPREGVRRIRLIMNTMTDQPYLNGAHVDLMFPHKTLLLYLNDSDGDTLIYKERADHPDWTGPLTLDQAVAPKANRAVLFDGQQLHTGTTPVKTARRVVLNINYE